MSTVKSFAYYVTSFWLIDWNTFLSTERMTSFLLNNFIYDKILKSCIMIGSFLNLLTHKKSCCHSDTSKKFKIYFKKGAIKEEFSQILMWFILTQKIMSFWQYYRRRGKENFSQNLMWFIFTSFWQYYRRRGKENFSQNLMWFIFTSLKILIELDWNSVIFKPLRICLTAGKCRAIHFFLQPDICHKKIVSKHPAFIRRNNNIIENNKKTTTMNAAGNNKTNNDIHVNETNNDRNDNSNTIVTKKQGSKHVGPVIKGTSLSQSVLLLILLALVVLFMFVMFLVMFLIIVAVNIFFNWKIHHFVDNFLIWCKQLFQLKKLSFCW